MRRVWIIAFRKRRQLCTKRKEWKILRSLIKESKKWPRWANFSNQKESSLINVILRWFIYCSFCESTYEIVGVHENIACGIRRVCVEGTNLACGPRIRRMPSRGKGISRQKSLLRIFFIMNSIDWRVFARMQASSRNWRQRLVEKPAQRDLQRKRRTCKNVPIIS